MQNEIHKIRLDVERRLRVPSPVERRLRVLSPPGFCRDLIRELAVLAKIKGKQALITTTSPVVLDGLNLRDDDQRLFVVSRDQEGHTVTKRVRTKPDWAEEDEKLSELWMRGQLDEIADEP